jgi:eukaryotic-like serine/threonine-protein kinase
MGGCRVDWESRSSVDVLTVALNNRFEVGERIRIGGQGVVFRARRVRDLAGTAVDDDTALKIHTNANEEARVDREIDALQGFDHPSLASVIEHGHAALGDENCRFVAWRFIDGSALDDRIHRGPVPPRTVACIGRDVSRAIDHIWQKRIVHRDINPKNIMLLPREDAAVLIDLGVARFLDLTTLTAAGRTWGTRGYFSPEQWTGDNLTCYSDVFALGVTLQEALSGRHPTGGDQQALFSAPPETLRICPTAPAALVNLIDRCLRLRPPFRPTPTVLSHELALLAAQLA